VECWGHNKYGELGDGVNVSWGPPVAVEGLHDVLQLAAADVHTCALLLDHTVKCWGYNPDGELGDGTLVDKNKPVAVTGLSGVTAIAAGAWHTCALLADGRVACWGDNRFGGLGNGTTTSSNRPVLVNGVSNAVGVTAGEYHSCALLADGTARCWGFNSLWGELGDGTRNDSSVAVKVVGLTNAMQIAAGQFHTCALLGDGTVQCWGENRYYGELGSGSGIDWSTAPIAVTGLSGVATLAAGAYHTCALMADTTLQCWGWNALYGQLGTGTTIDATTPMAVPGLNNVLAVRAGYAHTCAVLGDGTVECWGDNVFGDLGNGNQTVSNVPVVVTGL
jgi:alpha-tubulin suppressor-like RCC1 family protein